MGGKGEITSLDAGPSPAFSLPKLTLPPPSIPLPPPSLSPSCGCRALTRSLPGRAIRSSS